jgi:phosphate transport system protein
LARLRESYLFMGAKVEAMLASSMEAFQEKDAPKARSVIAMDRDVDQLELEIDHLCMSTLARFTPVGADLRFVVMSLKTVTDLERIGDLAVNIGERILDLLPDPPRGDYSELRKMAEIVQAMLRDALDAFVSTDVPKAQSVIERDSLVDELYVRTFHNVLRNLIDDRTAVHRGMGIQSIAKYLERMGDHATNLAEQVVFLVKGTDIRHSGHE